MSSLTERFIGRRIASLTKDERVTHESLRDFVASLEQHGDVARIADPVSPELEVTELCLRSIKRDGPALYFESPVASDIPVVGNVYGSERRVAAAIGLGSPEEFRNFGEDLAWLKSPQLPNNMGDAIGSLSKFGRLANINPLIDDNPPCQEVVIEKDDVDLSKLPIQHCWPDDVGKLITFGLVVTKGPLKERLNVGIYRQQVIEKNQLIMRWLPHRGGAIDFAEFCAAHPGRRFPVAVAIGADPATTLAAVSPVPDTISEYQFAGLLRNAKTSVARCLSHELLVPATAEIILEGFVEPDKTHAEGPFGDHTGYYNSVEHFPVFTVEKITHRRNPIYQATYMGKPPFDEPSVLAKSLNELFIPLLQEQFPEIVDFYLPPAACSYRVAVVSIRKAYQGHAQRIMMGIWSYLRQFTYTKMIIVTDDDVDIRSWDEVLWAISTRMDPARDTTILDNTPVDYLDFASRSSGLGSKIGLDATNKWRGETTREWGRPIRMSEAVEKRLDDIWNSLDISND
jgi:4-hydroxy-3-polyprenylbenzoate decarboxylase